MSKIDLKAGEARYTRLLLSSDILFPASQGSPRQEARGPALGRQPASGTNGVTDP